MKIGIDASRAFQKNRTGIEEYSYQVIKHLIPILKNDQVVLYIKIHQSSVISHQNFKLPSNWKIKIIKWPYLWTQIGLSLELLFHPVDVLFIPAHVVPIIHPKNTIVTIHGLEYEFCLKAYSFLARLYMRCSIKKSCRWAKKIIAVSQNTKRDLMNMYNVLDKKINVIYEGYNQSSVISHQSLAMTKKIDGRLPITGDKYLLFIGRLEERKNILGIIEAYKILKEKYKIPHKLVLAGKFGFGAENIKNKIEISKHKEEIILPGYISEEEKWVLLKNADIFLFPTFYEGFGLPILEAQSVGVPLVTSNNSSIPEVVIIKKHPLTSGEDAQRASEGKLKGEGDYFSALLVDPQNTEEIADTVYKLISDEALRNDIINKGYENVKRFSWEKCAEEIAGLLFSEK
jgi:glycosyltransferase involved in cell wall biosynthesis